MSGHLPRVVDADEPNTYGTGAGLVMRAKLARTVTITCQACKHTTLRLKVLSNSILNDDTANRLVTAHLDGLGWTRLRDGGADICPECANTERDVCPLCRDYTGGHTRTCPTQLPGAL